MGVLKQTFTYKKALESVRLKAFLIKQMKNNDGDSGHSSNGKSTIVEDWMVRF